MTNSKINATRLVTLTLALVALMGIARPIYSSTSGRANLKTRATPAVRPNCPQKRQTAPTNAPQRSKSDCPRNGLCCLCQCC